MEKQKRIVGDDGELLFELPKKKHEEYVPRHTFSTSFWQRPATRWDYIVLVFSMAVIGVVFCTLTTLALMTSVDSRHFNPATPVPSVRSASSTSTRDRCQITMLEGGGFIYICT